MKLVIFDVDGTLTQTNSVDSECFVKALADSHALTGINTNWGQYPHTTDSGITLHIFQERFGRALEADELMTFKRCFVNLLEKQYLYDPTLFAEIPGAAAALRRLRQEPEWAPAMATGCWRASALMKLSAAKIETNGIPAAFAEDGLSREEIIRAAVSKALKHYRQRNFEKIVSIGDGCWDVRAAIRLKIAFVGIGSGESEVMLHRAGAQHVIEDFADFDQLLRALNASEIPNADRS